MLLSQSEIVKHCEGNFLINGLLLSGALNNNLSVAVGDLGRGATVLLEDAPALEFEEGKSRFKSDLGMVSYHLEDVNEVLKGYQELIIEHDGPDLLDILLEIVLKQSLTL